MVKIHPACENLCESMGLVLRRDALIVENILQPGQVRLSGLQLARLGDQLNEGLSEGGEQSLESNEQACTGHATRYPEPADDQYQSSIHARQRGRQNGDQRLASAKTLPF